MWTRKSVKGKGKVAFLGNFWKCVLVAIILGIVLGTAGGSGAGGGGTYFQNINNSSSSSSFINNDDDVHSTPVDEDNLDYNPIIDDADDVFTNPVDVDDANNNPASANKEQVSFAIGAGVALALVVFIISLIATVIGLLFKYLLLSPFEYGCRKFFRKNLDEPAKLSNIVYVFDSHYKNVVKTAFMTDLFIFLWSLLFVIPGIIKSYSYRLVPYIVSENPQISYKDALAESARLMNGNKWKAFVLDLSFIGWDMLSAVTFGIVGLFYVDPYKASTDAALYEAIKYGIDVK